MNADNLRWKSLPVPDDLRKFPPEEILAALSSQAIEVMESSLGEHLPMEASSDARLFKSWVNSMQPYLQESPGFVLPSFPPEWEDLRLRYGYALFCQAIGKINNRYGWYFDVKDQGLDYRKQAIPVSKTRDSTGFHTDSTAAEYFPDLVGLLCLHPALEGGDSLMVNAANLYAHLKDKNPSILEILSMPLLRDVITPGAEQNTAAILQNKVPVFETRNDQFLFRYMRFWTEQAYEKTGLKPPDGLKEALDWVDNFFNDENEVLSFRMERGDVLMINNTFLCHNRTAFIDPGEGHPPRLLVRAWLNW